MVYDENNNPIRKAEISVAGINHDVTSGKKYIYFRVEWMKFCSVEVWRVLEKTSTDQKSAVYSTKMEQVHICWSKLELHFQINHHLLDKCSEKA